MAIEYMRDYTPEPTVAPTVEPTVEPTEIIPDRAVYDGDVSDSILRKLSAYYNDNASPVYDDYVILRESQYDYILAYGDVTNHSFNGTIVRYHVQQTYNSTDCTVSVTEGVYNADMTGDTGYIYSSLDGFLPSYYIGKVDTISKQYDIIVSVSFIIALLCILCFILFRSLRRRKR